MLFKKTKKCVVFVIPLFFILPLFFLNAETVDKDDKVLHFDLSLSPTSPKPGERVEIRTESNIDFSKEIVEWVVDGVLYEKKRGMKKITVDTGEVGETLIIDVKVYLGDEIVEKSVNITPVDVDVVWQANTYTPAQYKGKTLSSQADEGKMEFIALPKFIDQKKVESPQNYIFHWEIPGSDFALSGRGKSVFTVDRSLISHSSMILLKVEHINSDLVCYKNISLPNIGNPEVLIYKKNEYGIDYSKSLSHKEKVVLKNPTIRLVAEPLFFTGSAVKEKTLDINWFMNNKNVSDFQNSFSALFAVDKEFSGISSVSVTINNRSNFRERVSSQIILEANPNHN